MQKQCHDNNTCQAALNYISISHSPDESYIGLHNNNNMLAKIWLLFYILGVYKDTLRIYDI
jgi:hypothetical protein